MHFTLTLSSDRKIVVMKIWGNITRKAAMQVTLEAHALGKKLHIRRYLMDVTEAKNTELNIENYGFANEDMQNAEGIDRLATMAILVNPDDHSHDFVVTVSKNAGLNVKLFDDREKARLFVMGG